MQKPVAANVAVLLRRDDAWHKTHGWEYCRTLLFDTTRLKLYENGGQVWQYNVYWTRLISAERDDRIGWSWFQPIECHL